MPRPGILGGRSGKDIATSVGNLIWPGRSLISGQPGRGVLSPQDFNTLTFITGAICTKCGAPQDLDLGDNAICAACHANTPAWSKSRAALVYDDVSRQPILALKRGGRREGLATMAGWMALAGTDLLASADLIIPVPLHYRRLVSRGYNQAGWLAEALARKTGVPIHRTALKRIKPTPSQAGRSARQRHRNVRGAFAMSRFHRQAVEGKRVVLVDDVLTTGATANAATRALISAGATDASVLVLARVVRETDVTI